MEKWGGSMMTNDHFTAARHDIIVVAIIRSFGWM
jgi:hypothetical protein